MDPIFDRTNVRQAAILNVGHLDFGLFRLVKKFEEKKFLTIFDRTNVHRAAILNVSHLDFGLFGLVRKFEENKFLTKQTSVGRPF